MSNWFDRNPVMGFLLVAMGVCLLVSVATIAMIGVMTHSNPIENTQIILPIEEGHMSSYNNKFQSFELPSGYTVITRHVVGVEKVAPANFWDSKAKQNVGGWKLTLHLSDGSRPNSYSTDRDGLLRTRKQLLATIENAY